MEAFEDSFSASNDRVTSVAPAWFLSALISTWAAAGAAVSETRTTVDTVAAASRPAIRRMSTGQNPQRENPEKTKG